MHAKDATATALRVRVVGVGGAWFVLAARRIVGCGDLLMRYVNDTYTCALCGAPLAFPGDGAWPRTAIEGASGKPSERVIYLRGHEVHRCVIAEPRKT